MGFAYAEIDNTVNKFISCTDRQFGLKEVVAAVDPGGSVAGDEAAAFAERVERSLESHDELFFDLTNDIYVPKRVFFKDARFYIVPSEFEIENGILFPGHRLAPFCSPDVFPSEAEIFEKDGDDVENSEISLNVEDAVGFHFLLGSEQIFDFFIADSPDNNSLFQNDKLAGKVTLTVFDMKAFYRRTGFKYGDVLIFTVEDWNDGVFAFEFLAAADRPDSAGQWIDDLSDALEQVIEEFDNYLEIPEQLAWAFFKDRRLLENPGASLDEFIKRSDTIKMSYSGGHTVLSCGPVEQDENSDVDIPDEVSISQGTTESLEHILKEIGCPLRTVEIESFIYDQCYRRESDFDAFFRRCFGNEKLSFADDAQEMVFLNFIEDIWEKVTSSYNRHADEIKAPVRERIIELIEKRTEWLDYLKELDIDVAKLPQDVMQQIAEASLHLAGMLSMLNSESHVLQETEAEDIMEAVENIGELQDEYISKMNTFIAP